MDRRLFAGGEALRGAHHLVADLPGILADRLLDLGVQANVVEKSGSWFSYDGQRIGQGRENAKTFLKANPDVAAKIEAAVRQNSGPLAEQILVGGEEEKDESSEEE